MEDLYCYYPHILNNRPIGESETPLRMTIPNLQIHKIDFQPETVEYWEISLRAPALFWATPEASELDCTPIYLNIDLLKGIGMYYFKYWS